MTTSQNILPATSISIDDATIGIITVLPEEFAAACEILGCHILTVIDGRNYRLGRLKRFDQRETHVIVICCASDMGTATAAARTSTLLRDSKNVRHVIMCGIAGAVPNPLKPSDHVRLGDIVVLNRRGVVQYDFVKESEDGTKIRDRWHTPARALIDAAQQLALNDSMGERPWERYLVEGIITLERKSGNSNWGRPADDTDQLKEFHHRPFDYLRRVARSARLNYKLFQYPVIAHPIDEQRRPGMPRVFHGVIASANNLQKNPARRNLLRDRFGAMAVEMEGSGVGDAAYEADASFFVIRGTCDYCNGDKNDLWHSYAAVAAAAYTRALLEILPLQPILITNSKVSLSQAGKIGTNFTDSNDQHQKNTDSPDVLATATSSASTVVQSELDATINEILKSQIAESIKRIALSVDSMEIETAISEASRLESIVNAATKKIPSELLVDSYEWLARIAIVKGKQSGNLSEGLRKAEEFISKAKHVNGR